MEAQLLTSLNNKTLQRARRHIRFVSSSDISICYFLPEFDEGGDYACQYVRTTESCQENVLVFDYLNFMICALKLKRTTLGISIMLAIAVTLLVFYMAWLYVMGKHFIVPNAIAIAKHINMVGFDFGVTFISIALGFPDMLDSMGLCKNQTEFGSVMLSLAFGKIITCFTAGMVLLSFRRLYSVRPADTIITITALMACLFYLVEIVQHKLHEDTRNIRIHGVICLIVYALYLLYSVITVQSPKRIFRDSEFMEMTLGELHQNPKQLMRNEWQHLVYTINPFAHMPTLSKVTCILLTPIWLLQAILIPVADDRRPQSGWCKSAVCLSCFAFPFVLVLLKIPSSFFYVFLLIGFSAAAFTLLATSNNRKPKFHILYTIFGAFVTLTIYHIIDSEMDNLLWQMLTYVCGLEPDSLVVVICSWVYCVLEFVICSTLISSGFTDMAYGVVIGIAMFVSYTALPALVFKPCYDPKQRVTITANTFSTYVFCMLIFSYTMLNTSLANFQLRRSYGIYLLILYGFFVLYTTISLLGIIHSYGTKHSVLVSNDHLQVDWA